MKALTLIQPWAWAVAHARKNIENRTWPPPKGIIGQRIAIHAGKKLDKAVVAHWGRFAGLIPVDVPTEFVAGAVVAVATVGGTFYDRREVPANPWFSGPIGWHLACVKALQTPIPCRGAQGLWTLPLEVELEIRRQLEAPSLDRCLTCSDGVLDYRLGGMCGDCEVTDG